MIWLPAQALIHGLVYPATDVSTAKISIQHEHYLRSTGEWEYYDSICSAAVLGVDPLTLITAGHCLREVRLTKLQNLPILSIVQGQELGIYDAHLKQAFYHPYEVVADNVTQDLAVLVFDARLDGKLKPLPIRLNGYLPERAMICGYGRGFNETDTVAPRCAERVLLQDMSDFYKVLPAAYQLLDEMLHLKCRAQFGYTQELQHSEKALLAVNRLNAESEYDNQLAMPSNGDSGGPWLMRDTNGQYDIIAVTSLVERFYNKSPYWAFFDKDIPLTDYPYIAYGLRLNLPDAMDFLLFAKKNGADIQFVR